MALPADEKNSQEGLSPLRDHSFRVTNKLKALIAADMLRGDLLDHEPPVDVYRDFLMKHRSLCRHYFSKISDRYPEYLQWYEKMIMESESNGNG